MDNCTVYNVSSQLNHQSNCSHLMIESLEILEKFFHTYISFVVLGFIALITNTLIVLTILKWKGLHIKCYILIANLALADEFLKQSLLSSAS